MKKLLLILLCLPMIFSSCKKEEEEPNNNGNNNGQTYVPNTYFEQRLIDLGLDETLDDYVLTGNINDLEALDVSGENISDLTGIEDFTALITLNCNSNQLTTLDLSKNAALVELQCSQNQLTTLDLSNNTLLEFLNCRFNQITSLDLSNHTALYIVNCADNELTFLDLKNGNNINFPNGDQFNFTVRNNPQLYCINVDDAVYSNYYWMSYVIDNHMYYSNNCP